MHINTLMEAFRTFQMECIRHNFTADGWLKAFEVLKEKLAPLDIDYTPLEDKNV